MVAVDGDEGEDPGRRLHAHVRHEADVEAEEERLVLQVLVARVQLVLEEGIIKLHVNMKNIKVRN